MSYHSTADGKYESACQHIKEAIRDLSAIVVDEVDGHNDYNDYHVMEALQELIAIKKKLDKP